tara:strand:- start:3981 stop:4151 length:171 start_codon:yes stop_codon:yes gene_type:complete
MQILTVNQFTETQPFVMKPFDKLENLSVMEENELNFLGFYCAAQCQVMYQENPHPL